MKPRILNRRTLLRGAGGIALALPMLEVMAPRRAFAASPKRLVIFYTPNGTNDRGLAIPSQTGMNFTLPLETAPLAPLQKDLLVLSGIDMKTAQGNQVGDLHSIGMSHMLTCVNAVKADGYATPGGGGFFVSYAGGISVDQKIAQTLKPPTRMQSIELGVQSTLGIGVHPFSRMIYEDRLRAKPPQDDPRQVFKALVSNLPANMQQTPNVPAVDHSLEQRGSILDYVMDDYKRLSTQFSGLDKRKVDGHLQGLREIEVQLAAMAK